MIVTIPPDRSTTIREIRATERDDGNYSDVCVLFVRGGGEHHGFVVAKDLQAVLDAPSIGGAYWQVFRRKYRSPERFEEPELCGVWLSDDTGAFAGICANVVPCETHGEER